MPLRKVTIQYDHVTVNGKDCFKLSDPEVLVEEILVNPHPAPPEGTAYVVWAPVPGGHVRIDIHTGKVTKDDEVIWLKVRNRQPPTAPYLRAVVKTKRELHPLEGEPSKLVSPAESDAGAPIKRDLLNQAGEYAPRRADMDIHPENGCDHPPHGVDSDVHVEC